jgi:hypothetical protein
MSRPFGAALGSLSEDISSVESFTDPHAGD